MEKLTFWKRDCFLCNWTWPVNTRYKISFKSKSCSIRWLCITKYRNFIRTHSYNSYNILWRIYILCILSLFHLSSQLSPPVPHKKTCTLSITNTNAKRVSRINREGEESAGGKGRFEKVSKRVMDRRNDGGCVRETRKLVRRISRRNEAARGGAKYRAIDFTARRLAR